MSLAVRDTVVDLRTSIDLFQSSTTRLDFHYSHLKLIETSRTLRRLQSSWDHILRVLNTIYNNSDRAKLYSIDPSLPLVFSLRDMAILVSLKAPLSARCVVFVAFA